MFVQKVKHNHYVLIITAQYIALVLIAAIFIFPVLFMIISSLKPDLQLLRDTASLRAFLPVGDISMQNYFDAFRRVPIVRFMFNSLLVTVTTVSAGLLLNSMAAFSFAHIPWKGKAVILSAIIAMFIIPFESIAIPLMMMASKLPWINITEGFSTSWINSYHVQIIPWIAHPFQIYLFHQFFKEIPSSLIEAAKMEGAGWFHIYRKIVIPLSGPAFSTVAVLRSLEMWNQYLWPLITVQSERFRPVMIGLLYFFQLDTAWGEIMAYLTIITIPILIFYLLLQRTFMESIAATGVKE